MAKIIISFLGTGGYTEKHFEARGEYHETDYTIDEKEFSEKFVASALLKHHNADKIIFIGTLKAMWDEVYNHFCEDVSPDIHEKMWDFKNNATYQTEITEGAFIESTFSNSIISPILIKYGLNNDEHEFNIRQLFNIQEHINSGDKLYLDITHGFRSLPLVLTGVLNFLIDHIIKDVTIQDITYGMREVSNEMNGKSPIVSLNILQELNQTIKASHEFTQYGNAYLFSQILKNNPKTKSEGTLLNDFSDSIALNHIDNMVKSIPKLKGIKPDNFNAIQSLIIPKTIETYINQFKGSKTDSNYQYEIANWHLKNKSYGYAAIGFAEAIITKICECIFLDSSDEVCRNLAKDVFYDRNISSLKKDLYRKDRKDLISELNKVIDTRKQFKGYKKMYSDINEIRVAIAHAKNSKQNSKNIINNLKTEAVNIKNFIYSDKYSYILNSKRK